jgi:hypothetical protein
MVDKTQAIGIGATAGILGGLTTWMWAIEDRDRAAAIVKFGSDKFFHWEDLYKQTQTVGEELMGKAHLQRVELRSGVKTTTVTADHLEKLRGTLARLYEQLSGPEVKPVDRFMRQGRIAGGAGIVLMALGVSTILSLLIPNKTKTPPSVLTQIK